MPTDIQIAPSILSSDFSRLGEEVQRIDAAGADLIHIDVMDGHFVPNITFGPPVIKAIRGVTNKPFDVHLMISPADRYLENFVEAGADIVTVHAEDGAHTHRMLQTIKGLGVKAGISLNPATPVSVLDHIIDMVDLILIMTVNPGFGGQSFIPLLDKIEAVRAKITASGRAVDLEVDGGITPETAPKVIEAGANILVAGTAVFKDGPAGYQKNIDALRR